MEQRIAMLLVQLLVDPWFWAFLAATGWALAFGLVGTESLGRRLSFGIFMFTLAELPRVLLPLPFVNQPRLTPIPTWLVVLGALILVTSLYFGTPVFRIIPLTGPDRQEPLRTDGLYARVRHPLMLCDIFWPLGWSLIFGSLIGMALTPLWLLIIWALTHVEEQSLVREYGEAYRQYQSQVPRLLPGFHTPSKKHITGS
jgi:protein-S-isoprenylcysteine O-methyltransferase Ste14